MVGIALIGLVSALTMGIIERTREVGILRCVGAKARQVRRVFSAEALTLATVGRVSATLLVVRVPLRPTRIRAASALRYE